MNTNLFDLIKSRDITGLEAALKAGADPNIPDEDGEFPLNEAVFGGSQQMVIALLAAGADPNLKTKGDRKHSALDDGVRQMVAIRIQRERRSDMHDAARRRGETSEGSRWRGVPSGTIRRPVLLSALLERGGNPSETIARESALEVTTCPTCKNLLEAEIARRKTIAAVKQSNQEKELEM